jgi:RNA polymerase sigma factor (TIGR02999 family)
MSDVSQILCDIDKGDSAAAEQLLPLVYEELRRLAARRMSREAPGQTLEPTALVHEAYLRLVRELPDRRWDSRGHFFAAAAEAMRRILVDRARRKRAAKRNHQRQSLVSENDIAAPCASSDLLILDDALEKLASTDTQAAELVKLRFFAGLTNREAAECLGISPRTADNYWAYAKAWLLREIEEPG